MAQRQMLDTDSAILRSWVSSWNACTNGWRSIAYLKVKPSFTVDRTVIRDVGRCPHDRRRSAQSSGEVVRAADRLTCESHRSVAKTSTRHAQIRIRQRPSRVLQRLQYRPCLERMCGRRIGLSLSQGVDVLYNHATHIYIRIEMPAPLVSSVRSQVGVTGFTLVCRCRHGLGAVWSPSRCSSARLVAGGQAWA
jgi:hypothetical protein